jgi:hypothetical protein
MPGGERVTFWAGTTEKPTVPASTDLGTTRRLKSTAGQSYIG